MTDDLRRAEEAERDNFFGDLYFETTAELLTERMTWAEAGVIASLLEMREGERYLDLGCGHGRHIHALAAMGLHRVFGIDRAIAYLRRAPKARGAGGRDPPAAGQGLINGDIRSLPFASESFAGAFSWYSGLFLFDDETNLGVLQEVARIIRPGGLLLHHGANPIRLAAEPVARHLGRTRGGARVEEVATFDEKSGRESLHRRLVRPDGSVLEGGWTIRHHRPSEMESLLAHAGLEVRGFFDESGSPFEPSSSMDMVTLAGRA